jgi:hypothetical protein
MLHDVLLLLRQWPCRLLKLQLFAKGILTEPPRTPVSLMIKIKEVMTILLRATVANVCK